MIDHHVKDLSNSSQKKITFAIWLNVLITASQAVGGYFTGSLSILSDSLHNFSDVLALVICLLALWLAAKPQSLERTFGYKRAEIVAALVNILVLVIIGVLLIVEAFERIDNNQAIDSFWVIILALFSFVVNAFCGLILHSTKDHNLNIKAAYLHLVSDAMTSLAVAFGALVMYYTEAYWIDSFLTLLISFYLLFVAYQALKDILRVIMHFVPSGLDIKEIEKAVLETKDIKNLHHVHLWQLNDNEIHLEAHVSFKKDISLSSVGKRLSELKKLLNEKFKINHITLEPEVNEACNKDLVSED